MMVLRVENDKGEGPYQGFKGWGGYKNYSCDIFTQPEPWQDGIDDYALTSDHRFGFESFDQFIKWFNPKLRNDLLFFAKNGFKLVEYEGSDVLKGNRQVCFVPVRKVRVVEDNLASLMGVDYEANECSASEAKSDG